MHYVGIDIGSTATKTVIMDEGKKSILYKNRIPSGWNSKETGEAVLSWVKETLQMGDFKITATGYGRVSVPFADKTLTEISCHGKGAYFLAKKDITVIDIGGQDTKVIVVKDGLVVDFIMNDKFSAGTGKFLELMANRLGLSLQEISEYAARGHDLSLSSVCTVFAESEVTSLMGKGSPREDIARGVINQIVSKVVSLANRKPRSDVYFLTGGFSANDYIREEISKNLTLQFYPMTWEPLLEQSELAFCRDDTNVFLVLRKIILRKFIKNLQFKIQKYQKDKNFELRLMCNYCG